MQQQLIEALTLTLSALETPEDLTEEEVKHVIQDASIALQRVEDEA